MDIIVNCVMVNFFILYICCDFEYKYIQFIYVNDTFIKLFKNIHKILKLENNDIEQTLAMHVFEHRLRQDSQDDDFWG